MNPLKKISGILSLFCLLVACGGTDEEVPSATGYADVRFTALPATDAQTKADGSTEGLNEGGRVVVYAWQGKIPSETDKYAYSNRYTFHLNNGVCNLAPLSADMKLPVGNGYAFYALSTNHADLPVPAMETGSRTAILQNGVDYLMAVSGSQSVSGSEAVTIPLAFRHIATQIVLTVKPAGTNGYTSAESLTAAIAPIDSCGSYIDLSATWADETPNGMIYWGTGVSGGMPLGQANGQVKAGDKVDSGSNFTVSFILLPVAANAQIPLQFDFKGIEFATGGKQAGKRYTARLNVSSDGLKGGYTYAFDVSISRQAASFSPLPQVNPWVVDGINLDEVIEVDPK